MDVSTVSSARYMRNLSSNYVIGCLRVFGCDLSTVSQLIFVEFR